LGGLKRPICLKIKPVRDIYHSSAFFLEKQFLNPSFCRCITAIPDACCHTNKSNSFGILFYRFFFIIGHSLIVYLFIKAGGTSVALLPAAIFALLVEKRQLAAAIGA